MRTLGLKKLKTIEKGDVYLKTDRLCLSETIDWTSILNRKNSITVDSKNVEFAKNNCGIYEYFIKLKLYSIFHFVLFVCLFD